MNSNHEEVESLRWKKFPVLSDGFVTLVDCMGADESVVQAARVSYGKDEREDETRSWFWDNKDFGELWTRWKSLPEDEVFQETLRIYGGVPAEPAADDLRFRLRGHADLRNIMKPKDNRGLLRYLMRHRHTTPFEMAELKFLVRVPMDCWRQWIRHRMASVNEYSTRYTEAIDSMDKTPPDQWRSQSTSNKQGSGGFVTEWPDEGEGKCNTYCGDIDVKDPQVLIGDYLSDREKSFHEDARDIYEERLKLGVAREQARKDLPLSTYTEAYWKIDLHNLLHFLGLRMDSHAQKEIREYSTIIGEQIVKPLFPMVWEAFEDYRLKSISLSRLEIEVLRKTNRGFTGPEVLKELVEEVIENKREREECIKKLILLGFVYED